MEYIKKLIDRKNVKYIVMTLVGYILFLQCFAISSVTILLIRQAQVINLPISSSVFISGISSVLLSSIIYLIAFFVSIILIYKGKTVGYLISGIVSFLSFSDSISELVKNNIHYTWSMVPSTLVWTLIIVLSFWARAKLTKD